MTVFEWLISKPEVTVTFHKFVDKNYRNCLNIQMDICASSFVENSTRSHMYSLPIKLNRYFYDDAIPVNELDLTRILNRMYSDCEKASTKINQIELWK